MSDRPIPPRYEARAILRTEAGPPHEWSVFDSFVDDFCFAEYVGDKGGVIKAAARMNASYIRATAP